MDHPKISEQMVFFIHGHIVTLDIEVIPLIE